MYRIAFERAHPRRELVELGFARGPERVARGFVERWAHEAQAMPGAIEHPGERPQISDAAITRAHHEHAEHLAFARRVAKLAHRAQRDRMRLDRERARHPHRELGRRGLRIEERDHGTASAARAAAKSGGSGDSKPI